MNIIAVTIDTMDAPKLVCIGHIAFNHAESGVLGEFTRDDLEPGERCANCNRVLGENP